MGDAISGFGLVLGAIALVLAIKSFGINQEFQRGVVFRLGRLAGTKAGLVLADPLIDRVVKVDLRVVTFALDTQETVTRDGVAVRVNAVLWYRAVDPARVVTTVVNWQGAVIQAAETGMRDAIGQSDLDQMLKDRAAINARRGAAGDDLRAMGRGGGCGGDQGSGHPEQMQRAIAREAEAIREKRPHHQGRGRGGSLRAADRGGG
jgi:hypothetical protein